MTDIRERLNKRRDDLSRKESKFFEELTYGTHHDSYREASRNIAELRQIEAILATFQLSDTQMRLVKAQEAATTAQLAATEEQRIANEADSRAKADSEEVTFWTRRFLNTIAIASAAAFVSVLTFATKADSPHVPAADLTRMLTLFGMAAVLGAITPLYQLGEIRKRQILEDVLAIPDNHPIYSRGVWGWAVRSIKFLGKWDKSRWMIPAITSIIFALGMMLVMGAANGYLAVKPQAEAKPKPAEVRIVYVPVATPAPVVASPSVQQPSATK